MGFWQPARRSSPPCRSPASSPSTSDNRFPRPARVYLFAADFQLSEFLALRHPAGCAPLPGSFSCRPTSTHENGGRQRRVHTLRSQHLAAGAQESPAGHRAFGCWPPTLGVEFHRRPSVGCCWIRGCFLVECPELPKLLAVRFSFRLPPLLRSFRFVSFSQNWFGFNTRQVTSAGPLGGLIQL